MKCKLVINCRVHTVYSTCKRHCRYSDLGHDMFDMPVIIGDDVAQTNSKILLKIEAVDNILNGCFPLNNGFRVISIHLVFNVAPSPRKRSRINSDPGNMMANRV
ncbi:hypothetical protein TNIN_271241 [Trichonephila inaurata madagascariensis]|uniref:Uncharacterized protein n=1 Tax=Trichonephila inaurata madagascariensis TaxID=2747483 RepID=A0A8X6XWP3_9ARAC|nr:hypothetical protein TNIN_271241 [Trichonephila inaurata madagascariensis]